SCHILFLYTPHYDVLLFFFNVLETTATYTLSLHDALPIYESLLLPDLDQLLQVFLRIRDFGLRPRRLEQPADAGRNQDRESERRSEEHTSELQSRFELVCRLLLEKKKRTLCIGPCIPR